MSKVYNYMLISVGLTLLLKIAGLPSGADSVINFLGLSSNPSGIPLGTFFIGVASIFAIGTASGIVISFFTKSQSETFIIAPIALGIFTMITSTFISIILWAYSNTSSWVYYIIFLIFVPLLIAFAIAIISYWRGADA